MISINTYLDGSCYIFKEINGYVDHGDETKEFIEDVCNNEIMLLSYLFSDHSYVKTGNDNDGSYVKIDEDYAYWTFYKGN